MEHLIDINRLNSITGGDQSLNLELLTMFQDTIRECFKELNDAIKEHDEAQWVLTIHKMKGAANNIGVPDIGTLCNSESCFNPSCIEKMEEFMKEFDAEMEQIKP